MSEDPVYAEQRDHVSGAVRMGLQQMAAQLIACGFLPEAIADGVSNALLEGVGVLQGEQALDQCLSAALAFAHHYNGHASPEVAVQIVRDRLPELLRRIEAAQ